MLSRIVSTLKLMLNTLKEFSPTIAPFWFVSSIGNRSDFNVLLGSIPMWLSHPEFPSIVHDAWNNPVVLANAMTNFAKKARVWNNKVFGNLSTEKRELSQDLGVSKQLFPPIPTIF